jgi:hypothetical protein
VIVYYLTEILNKYKEVSTRIRTLLTQLKDKPKKYLMSLIHSEYEPEIYQRYTKSLSQEYKNYTIEYILYIKLFIEQLNQLGMIINQNLKNENDLNNAIEQFKEHEAKNLTMRLFEEKPRVYEMYEYLNSIIEKTNLSQQKQEYKVADREFVGDNKDDKVKDKTIYSHKVVIGEVVLGDVVFQQNNVIL